MQMESYVEITFTTNILICVLAYYTSAYFSMSKISSSSFYGYVFLEQLLVIFIFNKSLFIFFYLYECFLYYRMFRQNIKKGCMYICLKYLYMFTLFKLFHGSFHLLHYFVPTDAHIYICWLLLILFIILFKLKWSSYLKVSDFIYDVIIYGDVLIRVRAFLDTGNSVKYKDLPVLFLDSSYKSKFTKQKKKKYTFNL